MVTRVTFAGQGRQSVARDWIARLDTRSLTDGQSYRILATATDVRDQRHRKSILVTVDNRAPESEPLVVTIVSPAHAVKVCRNFNVDVSTTGGTAPISIDVAFGGTTQTIDSGAGSVTFDSTAVSDGLQTITATATDAHGQQDAKTAQVYVANIAGGPAVTVDAPTYGSTVSGTITVEVGGYSTGSPTVDVTMGSLSASEIGPLPQSVQFDTTRLADGPYEITAVVTDPCDRQGPDTIVVTVEDAP